VTCETCHHSVVLNVDAYPDDTQAPVPGGLGQIMTLIGPSRTGCADLIGDHLRQGGERLLVQLTCLVGGLQDIARTMSAKIALPVLRRFREARDIGYEDLQSLCRRQRRFQMPVERGQRVGMHADSLGKVGQEGVGAAVRPYEAPVSVKGRVGP
jgi:hypothetical protein